MNGGYQSTGRPEGERPGSGIVEPPSSVIRLGGAEHVGAKEIGLVIDDVISWTVTRSPRNTFCTTIHLRGGSTAEVEADCGDQVASAVHEWRLYTARQRRVG